MRFAPMLAACAALSLFACNSANQATLQDLRFDAAEASYIRAPGKATIEGHAFLRDEHGQVNVRFAAGEVVRLIPATSYARARMAHYYGQKKFVPAMSVPKVEPDPDYAAYTRTTKAESTGRFSFDHVAPGRYFVTTQLVWKPKDQLLPEGGAMYEEVVVTGSETEPVKVVLSGS